MNTGANTTYCTSFEHFTIYKPHVPNLLIHLALSCMADNLDSEAASPTQVSGHLCLTDKFTEELHAVAFL